MGKEATTEENKENRKCGQLATAKWTASFPGLHPTLGTRLADGEAIQIGYEEAMQE